MSFRVIDAANRMLNLAASTPEPEDALSWESMPGIALFRYGGIVYAFLLRWVPLNIAQVFAAALRIGVVIAVSLVLGGTDLGRAVAGDRAGSAS